MKKIILIFSVFVSVVELNIYSQINYFDYFRKTNELKYTLFMGDTASYLKGYNVVCQSTNYPYDYFDFAKVYFSRNKDTSIFLFKRAINCGYDLENMLFYFDDLQKNREFLNALENEQEKFISEIDVYYSKKLDDLADLDQKCRMEFKHNSEEEHYQYVEEVDKQNLNKLKQMVDSLGWPSYKKVGIKSSGNAFLILLHSLRYFRTDSDIILFFKDLLISEIAKGNFCPITFANLFDQLYYLQGKLQIYGSI